jgi:glycosyltransferase involved in cell wall biosynthesis
VLAVSSALAEEASDVCGVPVEVAEMPVLVDVSGSAPRGGVLAAGRLAPEKGFDVLIDACAMAGAPVTIVGDGPERDALAQRAEGLGVQATFPGGVSPAELHRLMAAASTVVVPSRREGLGLVAVEAVLCGTPVIASHTGGLPDALGAPSAAMPPFGTGILVPGGVLVRPGDAAGFAWALGQPLAPPGSAALTAAGRHRPDVVAGRHLHVYREVVGSLGSS